MSITARRLTFYSALTTTIAIAGIVLLYDYFKKEVGATHINFSWLFFGSILLIFVINFFAIQILFNFYGRGQIRKMSENLTEDIFEGEEHIGFKEITEKMNDLSERSARVEMMQEMETYRKDYIGNISHELKTPLFSIQGYIETLRDGAVDNLMVRDKYLERMGFSVERLIAIVKDLDMIHRLEAGEINLNITNFDIVMLIREVFGLLDLTAQDKAASLNLITFQPTVLVRADKEKIFQVITNLVSNAIHYANRQNATVTVIIHNLKGKIALEVKDNGMGIKKDILPRIFERFYRVESSRNRRQGGSGLGLAIVKHILEAHGESISVESEYLEGTSFRFMLNRA